MTKTQWHRRLMVSVCMALVLSNLALYAQAPTVTHSVCANHLITGTQWFLGTVAAGSAFVNLIISAAFAGALAGLNLGLWFFC